MRRLGLASFAAGAALALAPPAPPPHAQTDDGALHLSLGYDGTLYVKVLDMQIEEQATSYGFGASARLVSTGILALLKHINEQATSQGHIVAGEPRAGVFEYQHLSGKTHRQVRVVWHDHGVDMDAQPPFKSLGDPPASPQQKLQATDPLTALMQMTLNASRETVCDRSYSFFDGKQLYALDFSNQTDTPPSSIEKRLGLQNHFRCDVRFREVAGFGKKPPAKRNQGLKRAIEVDFAQVGHDGPWVISKVHGHTPLGPATVELKRLAIMGKDPTTWLH